MLSLVIPLKITRKCSRSVIRLSLRQVMRNTLRTNFSEMQVIFDNGMHGAMTKAGMNTNLFLCDSSVFSDHTINPQNNVSRNDSMHLSRARIVLQWYTSFVKYRLPHVHTCQGHAQFAIHSRHATMNLACSSNLSCQEKNHTSLFLRPFLMLDERTLPFAHLQSIN